MANSENRGGRPKTRGPEVRGHLGFQAPAHLRAQLEAAAAANQRSLSAEAVARLEQTFTAEQLLGGPLMSRRAFEMAVAFATGGRRVARAFGSDPDAWMHDPSYYRAAVWAVVVMLLRDFPGERPEVVYSEVANCLQKFMPLQPGEEAADAEATKAEPEPAAA